MDFIVSLAHFCEIHGPTTILCTQLSPISCQSCFPVTTPTSESLSKNASFSSSFGWDNSSPVVTPGTGPLFSPFTSPPTSPKSPTAGHNPYFAAIPHDGPNHRKFSFGSDSDGDSCDNCNLVVPKNMTQRGPTIIRTIRPVVARGAGPDEADDSDVSPTASDTPSSVLGTSPTPSHNSGAAASGSDYSHSPKHTHKLTYVTRRQPESQAVYSRLRRSCIRTLSCEQLPRGSSSGPLLFGDPIAGYTIAYMFRLPDPRARGRRRTYALTALGRDCWRVMAAFVPVTKAFESIASYIIALTDAVLERESVGLSRPPSAAADLLRTPPLSASLPAQSAAPPSPGELRNVRSHTNSPTTASRVLAEPSSFLTAKKVDPDGYPRMSREVMRAKGLPEIVGKEDFFVELHVRFACILTTLMNGLPR